MASGIRVTGYDELMKKLGGTLNERSVPERAMRMAQSLLINEASKRPPPIPGSKYVRTNLLSNSWVAGPLIWAGSNLNGHVSNNTVYGPWVQGDSRQARIHQGRWRTESMILSDNKDKIVRIFVGVYVAQLGE